jgi:hypothetical protein
MKKSRYYINFLIYLLAAHTPRCLAAGSANHRITGRSPNPALEDEEVQILYQLVNLSARGAPAALPGRRVRKPP